jgi:hypothetical protein
MDIIKNRIESISHLIELFSTYVEIISNNSTKNYEFIFSIKKTIKKISIHKKILYNIKPNTSKNIFEIINSLNSIDNHLHGIYTYLNTINKDIDLEKSNSFMINLEASLNIINAKYNIVINDNALNNIKLIHIVIDIVKKSPLDHIDMLFKQYINTINIYSHYIQYKLDNTDTSSVEYISILESLENAKTAIINNASLKGKKNINTSSRMQRYGLIPMWQHMDEQEVLKQSLNLIKFTDKNTNNQERMYGGYTPDKLTEMSNIFMEKNIGLYVMVLISPNQIEFDFKTLIHRKTVEKLHIEDNSGLNIDLITKFNNIKDIKGKFNDSIFKNIHLGKKNSDKWLIIRTMNGEHYDIMGLDKSDMFVNKRFIEKIEKGPSLLIDTYNLICSNKLLTHIKQPQEIVISSSKSPLKNIANKIIRELSIYIDECLETIPSNLKELFNIAAGPEIEDITSKIIIESYEDFGKSSINAELSSTFLFNSDYLISVFVKSIKEKLAKSNFNEFMFKEKTKNALIVHIRTVLSNIIKISAEKAFDPRNDIYENLMIKKNLLNIEL